MRLIASNVAFSYDSNPVLNDVSMEISAGEVVGVLGPNGSGKTTFVKCINRLLTPHQGSILLDDVDVLSLKQHEVAKYMGYVPQNSSMETSYPTVYEIVMMGRRPFGNWKANSTDEDAVWKAMEEMDVHHLALHRFNELSSGQTQRVLMARAIAQEAQIFLLDEPTSNLDIRYQIEVMETIRGIVEEKNVGACAIVHDLELAMKYCDKVILLYQGNILAAGTPVEVITPDNIRLVYGVEIVVDNNYGSPHVLVMGAAKDNS
ncbi:MAG: ABC transporter ATP-binding protein [Thermoplasmata archaeon]|nr:ABC transporter ATP-binding protein [Thermoplasmata archaeon]